MITICKMFSFAAAHKLPNHQGLCQNLHGHEYILHVAIEGDIVQDKISPQFGMIMDFGELKRLVTSVISKFDHSYLNDFYANPTAEIMVADIVTLLKSTINTNAPNYKKLKSVRLYETPTSYAQWEEDDNQ